MRSNYHRSELEMYMPCTQWLSKPSHQMCKALMLISNASKQQALSSVPHDSYTAIRILHAESGLVWKDNIVPFVYSALSFGVPESLSISMLHYQGSRNNWSPCKMPTMLQTSSYRTSDTGCAANMPNDPWYSVRFCRFFYLSICLLSRALVMGLRWNSAYRSVWLSATHWYHIPMTVVGFRPSRRAISRKNNPHFL